MEKPELETLESASPNCLPVKETAVAPCPNSKAGTFASRLGRLKHPIIVIPVQEGMTASA
ncbi:hypothetical protein [Neisseria dentiae]|uniref:hypothetical protein n=1 Tax=Neisseria dentiae TaxID=194197 RepID=UPI0035A15A82